jgi:F0F1-type ATP synthase membrane subunit b/b'
VAQDEKRRILDAARAQAEEKLNTVKADISRETKQATELLRTTVNELAGDMVKVLLKRKAA